MWEVPREPLPLLHQVWWMLGGSQRVGVSWKSKHRGATRSLSHCVHKQPQNSLTSSTTPTRAPTPKNPTQSPPHLSPTCSQTSTMQNTTTLRTSGRGCWNAANSPGSSEAGASAISSAGGTRAAARWTQRIAAQRTSPSTAVPLVGCGGGVGCVDVLVVFGG